MNRAIYGGYSVVSSQGIEKYALIQGIEKYALIQGIKDFVK